MQPPPFVWALCGIALACVNMPSPRRWTRDAYLLLSSKVLDYQRSHAVL